jgi:type IV secretory pathway VirB10-like protein
VPRSDLRNDGRNTPSPGNPEEQPPPLPEEDERPSRPGWREALAVAYRRARDGSRPRRTEINTRGEKSVDRSKTFLLLAATAVIGGFAFLVLFSMPTAERRAEQRRTTPNLGRPEAVAGRKGAAAGSVAPLLHAHPAAGEASGDLSPEDILATSRRSQQPEPRSGQAPPPGHDQDALGNVQFGDPALEAYRRQHNLPTYVPQPAQPAIAAPPPAPPPPKSESDALTRPSLVFVRDQSRSSAANPAPLQPQPALATRRAVPLLTVGTKLVARLQSAASSAVKAPVVATIEYNYERDGEIVLPAGTKAFGALQQANQQGQVGIQFHSLQLPDGRTEAINGSAMSLDHGPLKGDVNGRNRGRRVLVRSLTGIGTVAAYMVGGRGGVGGLGGLDNSVLLRERVASNVAMAGEQEMMRLAYQQNIVVTVPGNTRFYIVLHEGAVSKDDFLAAPGSTAAAANLATTDTRAMPTAAELRELVDLKRELQRIEKEVAASRKVIAPPPTQP